MMHIRNPMAMKLHRERTVRTESSYMEKTSASVHFLCVEVFLNVSIDYRNTDATLRFKLRVVNREEWSTPVSSDQYLVFMENY